MATALTQRISRSRKWNTRLDTTLAFLALSVLAILLIGIPFGWMLTTSLKSRVDIFAWPPVLFPSPLRWDNYSDTLEAIPLLRFAANTLLICALSIIGRVLSCTVVAYAFARLRFPGRNVLFLVLLSTLMIPGQMLLIPRFAMFNATGLIKPFDGYLPLVLPAFFGDAFFIFLLRQYIMTLPRELDEAARIDGASTWGVLWRIIVPLTKPAIFVVAVLTFLWTWNEFLDPLIYINKYDSYTLQLGLNMLKGRFNVQWNLIMAGSLMAMVPCVLIYFFSQKQLVGGISSVGVKG